LYLTEDLVCLHYEDQLVTAEDGSVDGCDCLYLGKYSLTFQRILVPFSSGLNNQTITLLGLLGPED